MREPNVNNGVSGPRNYDSEVTKAAEELIKRIKANLPISSIYFQLADTTDKKWNSKKENEYCNSCDTYQSGYKTESMCKGCQYFYLVDRWVKSLL